MKEFIEKLIERLEEEKSDWNFDYNVPINKAIEIVNELAEEHKGGWISVYDELPNVTRCRVTVQYDMDFGEVVYDTMDATFSRFGIFGSEYRFEDSWRNDITNNVIAWQPLPKPYNPKGE